ncbi:Enhancer of rudimentary [Babesia microti strain RI]|uniref:Enhancer of rudimentary n=1 Tax=Babesia microti (strain RI) TaxID=1133968 RepID=I7I898_BABMR|nr:Enhancer of rudimentary [Babesia microti strain RI]CCF72968.1 Enhancer of rudimentary [Babesia microti strain RI]|eukprot:XP_012647577.1 Enhancer of rudimentary [Babesia microti strain RI]
MNAQHTIVMVQFTSDINTRTYIDYDSIQLALDGICQTYEQALKHSNPQSSSATYTARDLFAYLDALCSICALVRKAEKPVYMPRDKQWIKNKLIEHLKSQTK